MVPLCYGVQQNRGNGLVQKFQSMHPQYITFPKGEPTPFFLEDVGKEVFLAEDQMGKIVCLLEQELQTISIQVDSASAPQA